MAKIKGTISDSEAIEATIDEVQNLSGKHIFEQGPKGENGLSAYEIAVNHGFKGTEQEWLALYIKSDELKLITQQEAQTDFNNSTEKSNETVV